MWIFLGTLTYILFLLVCVLSYAVEYLTQNIEVNSFSQVLYTMRTTMGGAENTILQILLGFLFHYAIWIILVTVLYVYFLKFAKKVKREGFEKAGYSRRRIVTLNCSVVTASIVLSSVLCTQTYNGYHALGIGPYLEEQNHVTTIYEDKYVPADSVNIAFNGKKKNLIYLFCESMETTYASTEDGGGMENNLIPNLSSFGEEYNDFSADGASTLNGAKVTNYTSWTIAGILAQTSATPLGLARIGFDRDFAEDSPFMPAVTGLGEILEDYGYHNYFLCGSEASYGGRANYFRQHGDYTIYDLLTAREDGWIPENYKEWWGFEDSKLFDFARTQITEIAKNDEPFNFTFLTADTHFLNGYKCPDCPDTYDKQYENVIACSDHRIADFVNWCKQQPWYEDTVIVIAGDHLSMDAMVAQSIEPGTDRKTVFLVINGPEYSGTTDRVYTTMDAFPTTLGAIGASIEGDRLGLGTNLYSATPTLSEEMGFDNFNHEIAFKSDYYDNVLLDGMKEEG